MFTNKKYQQQHELQRELQHGIESELSAISTKLGLSRHQVGTKLEPGWNQVVTILDFCKNPQPRQAIMDKAECKDRTKFRNKYIKLFMELEFIQMTILDKPNSSKQKYIITEKGNEFLKHIKGEK